MLERKIQFSYTWGFGVLGLYYTYSLTTKPQSNDRGDWYGWDIKRSAPVSADVYAEGKAFHASVKKGGVEVNYEQESTGSEKTDNENPF